MNRREFIAGLATLAVAPKEAVAKSLHGPLRTGTTLVQPCWRWSTYSTVGYRIDIEEFWVGDQAAD